MISRMSVVVYSSYIGSVIVGDIRSVIVRRRLSTSRSDTFDPIWNRAYPMRIRVPRTGYCQSWTRIHLTSTIPVRTAPFWVDARDQCLHQHHFQGWCEATELYSQVTSHLMLPRSGI